MAVTRTDSQHIGLPFQGTDALFEIAHFEHLRDLRQREDEARAVLAVDPVRPHVAVDFRHFPAHSVEVVQVDAGGQAKRRVQSSPRSPGRRL